MNKVLKISDYRKPPHRYEDSKSAIREDIFGSVWDFILSSKDPLKTIEAIRKAGKGQ